MGVLARLPDASENVFVAVRLKPWLLWPALSSILLGLALGAAARPAPQKAYAPAAAEDRVDINRASVTELMRVPGMTRTWAERIVRFRPYRTKLDLLEYGVVPIDVYQRIRDYVIAHQLKP